MPAPGARRRPTTRARRLDMLHRAVGVQDDDRELVTPRLLLLLTSPFATLYWKDYLGITAREAAWSIHVPADRHATTLT